MKRLQILVLFLLLSTPLYSAGISSPCGGMYLGNLKIGQSYSLQQCLGYPFSVTYKASSMVELRINLKAPTTTTLDGFEPIPDLNWIKVIKDQFSLDPGQSAETDILITIPNDEKLMGKKYLVNVNPVGSAPQKSGAGLVFGIGLMCKLELTIASKPPTPEEIRQIKKQQLGGVVSVLISPERIFLVDVPTGKKIDLKKDYQEGLKIVNSTDFKLKANISSVDVVKAGMFAPIGYKLASDPNWLKVGKSKITIGKNSIQDIPLYLEIPDTQKGEKLYFVIVTEASSKIRNVRYFTKVYVDAAK
ncbi:MAG: hypothetical protein KKH91_07020 [Elusimicrobia bacterium]|nr:hypothetical protein [Elusimicrobiota bacterium]MBU2614614.1 hypothetical protein [Elusimicrobiota bacterium]